MMFEEIQYLNPNVFRVVERKDMPSWRFDKRQNGYHELYFIVGGKAVFYVNDVKYIAVQDDTIYIPGGSVREAHTFEDSPIHTFAINFHWLGDNHVTLPFEVVTKNKITPQMLGYLRELAEMWANQPPLFKFKERGLFLLLLHQLFNMYYQRKHNHIDSRIKKAMDYVQDNFSKQLDIEMMARMANLNPIYYGKIFKENTGYTFRDYLNRIRVTNAEKLLSTQKLILSEVAEQCGFNDVYYFSKMFKRVMGYAPSSHYNWRI